jgi:2,4-dienoyl-CoA reductase-like NADH-dependent reductase (Old Yellow Enzyme family)
VRSVIPETMPLLVRISASEWMEWKGEPSWDMAESVRLAKLLPDLGVDLLDVSSGGNNSEQKIKVHPHYQIDLAGEIRDALKAEGKKLLIGAVGMITTAEMAHSIVQEDGTCKAAEGGEHATGMVEVDVDSDHGHKAQADLIIAARQFLREPEFVLRTAHKLGVEVQWPVQYHRAGWRKGQQV